MSKLLDAPLRTLLATQQTAKVVDLVKRHGQPTWAKSHYRGVSYDPHPEGCNVGPWRSYIYNGTKRTWLGRFWNPEDAARAYNRAARKLGRKTLNKIYQ